MPGLSTAMTLLKETFDKYAGKDGDCKTLTKVELAELFRKEMLCEKDTSNKEMDKFFSALDNDKDGLVDFIEYVTFVASLTVVLNE